VASPLKRAKLLKGILSNCTLNDGTPCPTYREPFSLIAKGLSRSNWLPALAHGDRVPGDLPVTLKTA